MRILTDIAVQNRDQSAVSAQRELYHCLDRLAVFDTRSAGQVHIHVKTATHSHRKQAICSRFFFVITKARPKAAGHANLSNVRNTVVADDEFVNSTCRVRPEAVL